MAGQDALAIKKRNWVEIVAATAVGGVLILLGVAVFVQYRVHTAGLAL